MSCNVSKGLEVYILSLILILEFFCFFEISFLYKFVIDQPFCSVVLYIDATASFFYKKSIAILYTRYTLQTFACEVLKCISKLYKQYTLQKFVKFLNLFSINEFIIILAGLQIIAAGNEVVLLDIMKHLIVLCVLFHTVTTSAVATTKNRILLSSVLVGTALAASICKCDSFMLQSLNIKGPPHTWEMFCIQAHSSKLLKDMDFFCMCST